jgi:hypothetical protein
MSIFTVLKYGHLRANSIEDLMQLPDKLFLEYYNQLVQTTERYSEDAYIERGHAPGFARIVHARSHFNVLNGDRLTSLLRKVLEEHEE